MERMALEAEVIMLGMKCITLILVVGIVSITYYFIGKGNRY